MHGEPTGIGDVAPEHYELGEVEPGYFDFLREKPKRPEYKPKKHVIEKEFDRYGWSSRTEVEIDEGRGLAHFDIFCKIMENGPPDNSYPFNDDHIRAVTREFGGGRDKRRFSFSASTEWEQYGEDVSTFEQLALKKYNELLKDNFKYQGEPQEAVFKSSTIDTQIEKYESEDTRGTRTESSNKIEFGHYIKSESPNILDEMKYIPVEETVQELWVNRYNEEEYKTKRAKSEEEGKNIAQTELAAAKREYQEFRQHPDVKAILEAIQWATEELERIRNPQEIEVEIKQYPPKPGFNIEEKLKSVEEGGGGEAEQASEVEQAPEIEFLSGQEKRQALEELTVVEAKIELCRTGFEIPERLSKKAAKKYTDQFTRLDKASSEVGKLRDKLKSGEDVPKDTIQRISTVTSNIENISQDIARAFGVREDWLDSHETCQGLLKDDEELAELYELIEEGDLTEDFNARILTAVRSDDFDRENIEDVVYKIMDEVTA
ncbi:MAG: hypothetical protein HQ530_03500 [Parcubacteria group bacterium]|nr:hypothetical protein [Parcubacteria group bacterium]